MKIYNVTVSTYNEEFEADIDNISIVKCIKIGDKFADLNSESFYESTNGLLDYEPNKMYAFDFEEFSFDKEPGEFRYLERAKKVLKKYKSNELEELYVYVEPKKIEYNEGLYYAYISKAVIVELNDETGHIDYVFDDEDIYESIGIVRDGKFYNLDDNKYYDIVDARDEIIILQDNVNIETDNVYALELEEIDTKNLSNYFEYKKCIINFNKEDFENANEKEKGKVIKFPRKR